MIALDDITLDYPGPGGQTVRALHGVSLRIQPGEVFGIIGRSGAGKSSLVRCINLLNRPTQGRVAVAGTDLMALPPASLRAARREIRTVNQLEKIESGEIWVDGVNVADSKTDLNKIRTEVGFVFQHFNLLSSRTVFDNAALPLELAGMDRIAIRERVMPLLELVGLSALADRYPAQISGGQKQRVGIARALASRPKVLLSDEATSALDPETTRSILALLQQINRELGLTVVLITHQMQVIRQIAHRVAVMDAGRVVEQGAVLDVFTRPQQPITRSLIDEVMPQTLPASVRAHMAALHAALPAGHAGRLLRLIYAGERAEQPVLSRLIREHGVDVSILHGQMDEIQGQTFGSLAIYASGPAGSVQAVAAGLAASGVQVQDVTDEMKAARASDEMKGPGHV